MSYKRTRFSEAIQRLADGAWIPNDPENRDYQEMMKWVAAGNTILDADPEPPPTQDQLDVIAAKEDTAVIALKSMTPTQAGAWVDTNVNNLADAKALLKTMAKVLCVLARRI